MGLQCCRTVDAAIVRIMFSDARKGSKLHSTSGVAMHMPGHANCELGPAISIASLRCRVH